MPPPLTILLGQFAMRYFFQIIMLAELPVKSGLRSYGGLQAKMKTSVLLMGVGQRSFFTWFRRNSDKNDEKMAEG